MAGERRAGKCTGEPPGGRGERAGGAFPNNPWVGWPFATRNIQLADFAATPHASSSLLREERRAGEQARGQCGRGSSERAGGRARRRAGERVCMRAKRWMKGGEAGCVGVCVCVCVWGGGGGGSERTSNANTVCATFPPPARRPTRPHCVSSESARLNRGRAIELSLRGSHQ